LAWKGCQSSDQRPLTSMGLFSRCAVSKKSRTGTVPARLDVTLDQ
jgi:hypothetical protein